MHHCNQFAPHKDVRTHVFIAHAEAFPLFQQWESSRALFIEHKFLKLHVEGRYVEGEASCRPFVAIYVNIDDFSTSLAHERSAKVV